MHSTQAYLLVAIREDPIIDEPESVIDTLCVVDANTGFGRSHRQYRLLRRLGEGDGVVLPLQAYLLLSKTGGEASGDCVVWKLCLGEGHHWHFVSAIKDVLQREIALYDKFGVFVLVRLTMTGGV